MQEIANKKSKEDEKEPASEKAKKNEQRAQGLAKCDSFKKGIEFEEKLRKEKIRLHAKKQQKMAQNLKSLQELITNMRVGKKVADMEFSYIEVQEILSVL